MPNGPEIIVSKLANALIADAQPTVVARALSGNVTGLFSRFYGGLWVGGTVTLTTRTFGFTPNAMNRALHVKLADVSIPLERIVGAVDRYGVVTRIVDVRLDDGTTFTFRCFGAPALARQIEDAAKASRAG